MEALTRTRAVGGSLIVTIPKEIVKEKGIEEGELVKINVEKIKKDWFGCLRGLSPFTKEDEMKWHD